MGSSKPRGIRHIPYFKVVSRCGDADLGPLDIPGHIETDNKGFPSGVVVGTCAKGVKYHAILDWGSSKYAQSFYTEYTLWQRIRTFLSHLLGHDGWIEE